MVGLVAVVTPVTDNPHYLEPDAIWQRWADGECRCPHCYWDDEVFHTVCDCSYHEQVCAIEGCLGK